jgi:F-type H+-transporting ATPase subunit b
MLKTTHAIWTAGLVSAAPALVRAASESDGGGGSEGGIPLLSTTVSQFLLTLILFGALLFILGKFVWPHILKTLQDRESKMREDLKQAEQANKEAQQTLEQYKQQLAEAQKESQRIIDQSRSEAEELKKQWKQQTQQELDQMRQRAEQEIAAAKEQAVNELYEQSAALATDVAGRILGREISAEDQKQLVEQSLRELEQRQSQRA